MHNYNAIAILRQHQGDIASFYPPFFHNAEPVSLQNTLQTAIFQVSPEIAEMQGSGKELYDPDEIPRYAAGQRHAIVRED
jgi:hypothetical protein